MTVKIMATLKQSEAGTAFNFVEDLPDLFKCGVCRLVLRDPQITECCGKNACHSCIIKVAEEGGPCPIPGCGCQKVKINFNRGLRSDILESAVYCQSKEAGCEWVGKLDELTKHLKEVCPFVEEECQYLCGVRIQRKEVEDHKKVCKRLPIECHQCREMYERCHHTDHVKVCPFTKIECPFNIVGCNSKVANKDMQQHFNDSLSKHCTMVVEQSQSVQAQLREANLTTQYQKEKLALDSAEIDLLSTEITDELGAVSALKHTLEEAEREYVELQKVHEQLKDKVEAHSQHIAITSHVLKKDFSALTFESKMRCYGPALPSIKAADIVSRPVNSRPTNEEYTPELSFTIQNFEGERQNDAVTFLPPFYSHNGGYKMCLVVYCNGYREAKGKYMTVLVNVLKGKYDHLLGWPLNCSIIIEIKDIYGPGTCMQRYTEVNSQNRVYEDNFLSFQYCSSTKIVHLGSLASHLNFYNGSLTVNIKKVIVT
jgi:hypothetical protein